MTVRKSRWWVIVPIVLIPKSAHADVVWPALYVESKMLSVPVIAIGLLLESLMLRFGLQVSWKRAIAGSLVVNLVSTIAGIVLIPLAGILWEIFPGLFFYFVLNIGTFNPVTWAATFFLTLGITTGIEVVCLKWWFHIPYDRRTWTCWTLINAVTVGMAFASLPEMTGAFSF